jgi:hypothetical protein
MRNAIGAFVLGCVVVGLVGQLDFNQRRLFAQLPPSVRLESSSSASGLIALSSDVGESQQVTVIDPVSRVMSVYHIDRKTGTISLKSVRNIHADLLMDELNTENPLPREIRAILKQR